MIDVTGGVSQSANITFNPAPVTRAAVTPDPLSALPEPSTSGMTNFGRLILGGNSRARINPGIYSQITVSGNAALTLNPGTYIIEGGGFATSGKASVTGTGVTIWNAGSKFPSVGGNYRPITLASSGTLILSPPTTGPYAGLLFIQPADNTQTLTFLGNAVAGASGMIYAPSAHLLESGVVHLSAPIVVDTLTINGDAVTSIATNLVAQATPELALAPLPVADSPTALTTARIAQATANQNAALPAPAWPVENLQNKERRFPAAYVAQASPPLEAGARGGPSRRPPSQNRRATENAVSPNLKFASTGHLSTAQPECARPRATTIPP